MNIKLINELSSDPQVAGVDLTVYSGVRHQLFDGKGNMLEDTDTRDLILEKALKLKSFKQIALDETLEIAPIITQLNQMAGRLSIKENHEINEAIDNARSKYSGKKQKVLDCETLDDLDLINW